MVQDIFPFHHHHPPIYNNTIKRSTVNVYLIDRGRSARVSFQKIPCLVARRSNETTAVSLVFLRMTRSSVVTEKPRDALSHPRSLKVIRDDTFELAFVCLY